MAGSGVLLWKKRVKLLVKKSKYIMNHPNYVVFLDEVGDNTSQKDDGNIGGTKYVVGRKSRELIIACSENDAKLRMGIQPWCEIEGDENLEDNLAINSQGKGKYFLFVPICIVDDKEIPMLPAVKEVALPLKY